MQATSHKRLQPRQEASDAFFVGDFLPQVPSDLPCLGLGADEVCRAHGEEDQEAPRTAGRSPAETGGPRRVQTFRQETKRVARLASGRVENDHVATLVVYAVWIGKKLLVASAK